MAVNIGKILLRELKRQGKTLGLRSAALVKSTNGARTPGSLTDGPVITTTSYNCQALIEVLTVDDVPGTLVQQDDRKIGVLGASLARGVIPSSNDRITLVDVDGISKTFRLVQPVSGDGVGAMYEFVARK